MKRMKAILVSVALLLFVSQAAALSIDASPSTNPDVGQTVTVEVSTTDSQSSIWIERWSESYDEWIAEKMEFDCDSGCSLTFSYQKKSEGSIRVRGNAGGEDATSPLEITWGGEETTGEEAEISSIDIDPGSDETVGLGENVKVTVTARGTNMESIWIERWSHTYNEWITERLNSAGCSGSECVVEYSFRKNTDSNILIRGKAVARNGDSVTGKTSEIEINWEEKEEPNQAPEVSLTSPVDEAEIELPSTFSWNADDPEGDSVTNTIIIRRESDGNRVLRESVGTEEEFTVEEGELEQGVEYNWRVRAEDDQGNSATSGTRTFNISEVVPGNLSVSVSDYDGDSIENAEVAVNGESMETDGSGNAEFTDLQPGDYSIEVSCGTFQAEEDTVVEQNETVSVDVEFIESLPADNCRELARNPTADFTISDQSPVVGEEVTFDASPSSTDSFNIFEYKWEFENATTRFGEVARKSFDSTGQKDVTLTISTRFHGQDSVTRSLTVLEEDGEDGDDDGDGEGDEDNKEPEADLDIDPGDADTGETIEFDATDSTDPDGDIEEYEFDLDGDGVYEIEDSNGEIEKAFHEKFSRTAKVRVTDNDGDSDTASESYRVESKNRLTFRNIQSSKKVCEGESFNVQFDSKNVGEDDRLAIFEGRGLGNVQTYSVLIEEDEQKSVTITFTNTQGTGTKTFSIDSRGGNSDIIERSIELVECPGREDGKVSRITMDLVPDRTIAGKAVKVSGHVDNTRGRRNVEILVNGRRIKTVSTEPDGFYQSFIYPETTGRVSVTASSSGRQTSSTLKVLPSVEVTNLEVESNIFQGEEFEVCGRVESQIDPLVFLVENGERTESRYGSGEVCFETTNSDAGEHNYQVMALAKGQRSSATKKVEILEDGAETRSFPEQVASVESGDGIVKATLYNNHRERKRYSIEINGLPETWTSTTEKEVVLQPGEERKVFFYLKPREEGRFAPEIAVESGGDQIYEEEVIVEVGGTKEKNQKSLVQRILFFL